MGKNKLRKFAEMETFSNVYQFTCSAMDEAAMTQPHPLAGKWGTEVFGNDHPIVLELGCGRGDYTVGLGAAHPEKNYIGIDIKGARLWAGAKQALQDGLRNVAFLRTNIEILPLFFAANEVSEIWITFPDPQMKKATKRLTSTYFMARYARLLQPDGRIHLKTDSPFLYAYTRAMIAVNGLPLLADSDDLYAPSTTPCAPSSAPSSPPSTTPSSAPSTTPSSASDEVMYHEARLLQTHYEHQWLDRGMTIKYLCWQLPAPLVPVSAPLPAPLPAHQPAFLPASLPAPIFLPPLVEPEVEIEHDTYRSYGRNYG